MAVDKDDSLDLQQLAPPRLAPLALLLLVGIHIQKHCSLFLSKQLVLELLRAKVLVQLLQLHEELLDLLVVDLV